jgi:hypothetical protein
MWINNIELNGVPDIDDDGNGYVDDVYGYDFADADSDPRDINDPNVYGRGHGTYCAGILGAVGNNGEGITGVCWNVRVMALKIFSEDNGDSFVDAAIEALDYAVRMGASITSNSWVIGEYHQGLKNTIEAANQDGVLFIGGAGNDGESYAYYPAGYNLNNIISVMATDANDQRSIWTPTRGSNWGLTSVDLAAPGSNILSCGLGGGYEFHGGTSAATPHVSGACALMWSVRPSLSHLEVKQIILDTVDELEALDGLCVTGGRLNIYNAILEATKREDVLNKLDDIHDSDSVLPGDYITYTIQYANSIMDANDPNYLGNLTNVQIVDYLPEEIDPCDIVFSGPNSVYDILKGTVIWQVGMLSPGSSNSVILTVKVNEHAEPMGTISNSCAIYTNEVQPITSTEITDVNSWDPNIIYVDKRSGGSNTGMSWDSAYTNLQQAFERARHGCGSTIWIAEGTYKPTYKPISGSVRSISFQLPEGVSAYGGFPSGGGRWEERNPNVYETTLSGDIGAPNDHNDNSYHVLMCKDVNNAILDGFTITAGNANGSVFPHDVGAGMRNESSSPRLVNCMFAANSAGGVGGGMHNNENSKPMLTDCIFSRNTADNYGGGMSNWSSAPEMINCTFTGNQAGNSGGGMDNYKSAPRLTDCTFTNNSVTGAGSGMLNSENSNPILTNCLFSRNSAGNYGGGMSNWSSAPEMVNCTFTNNLAGKGGGGIDNYDNSNPTVTNCVLWGNIAPSNPQIHNYGAVSVTVSYSDIQGGWPGVDNIDADPCFVDVSNPDPNLWNLRLKSTSPCIDRGDNNAASPAATDLDSHPRIIDGDCDDVNLVDIGAYEFNYAYMGDFDYNCRVDFFDFSIFGRAWEIQEGDPGWDWACDISDPTDDYIDWRDAAILCENWLAEIP